MNNRILVTGAIALAFITAGLTVIPAAQAKHCYSGANGDVRTIHTSCATAGRVIEKAGRKVPASRFRVYVNGWWHCNFTRIAGHPTTSCERHYGTPRRQVVIIVVP